MEDKNTIIHTRWLLPMSSQNKANKVLEYQTLIIKDDKIEHIVSTASFHKNYAKKYAGAKVTDLSNHIVMPGLINAHTHAAMTLFRGIADDMSLMTWLNDFIWPLEAKWVDAEFVEVSSKLAMLEMIKAGVTCFNDMYFYPEITAKYASEFGMRMVAGMPIIEFASSWAVDVDDYFKKGLKLHDYWRDSPLISTMFAPHAPYTVSDDTFIRVRQLADEIDVGIHTHLHETQQELDDSLKNYGLRPIERLDKLGILSERLLAVHMVALNDQDIDLVGENKVNIAHCPQANLKLASGIAPITKLLANGINIALGTDSVASNNDLDMLDEAKTAALLAKGISLDAKAIEAYDALEMLTINAAKALALDSLVGSLEVNKQADIIAIDMSFTNTQPLYNPISHLIYSAKSSQVSHSWINGKQMLAEGKIISSMETLLQSKINLWQNKISKGL